VKFILPSLFAYGAYYSYNNKLWINILHQIRFITIKYYIIHLRELCKLYLKKLIYKKEMIKINDKQIICIHT